MDEFYLYLDVKDLDLLETPREFQIYLKSLSEEYELTDLTEMYLYFFAKGKFGHCDIIEEFNKSV